MHIQPMREIFKCTTTRTLGRLALALGLALPLNFAAARQKPAQDAVPPPASVLGDYTAAPRLRHVVRGPARVIDGDTLEVNGTRVRLEGIDAPELSQNCSLATGQKWRCGRSARKVLLQLIDGGTVNCTDVGRGTYGRMLGQCSVNGVELNAELVRRGLAWAFVKYSRSYVAVEAQAKAKHKGIWQGSAMPAWDYRSGRWDMAQSSSPNGCAIKGNISRHGRIYHMPWNSWYSRVKIDQAKGERWFCSEGDAVAAGWRAAHNR